MTAKISQTFVRFLKDLGVYETYCYNYNRAKTSKMHIFFEEVDLDEVINYAFNWDSTLERHMFWCIINAIWVGKNTSMTSIEALKCYTATQQVEKYIQKFKAIEADNFSFETKKKNLYE